MDEDLNSSKCRTFVCSCGKDYLSYAALFTHIKQKHGGKAPGPIVRPRSERKRGRPRKNENRNDNESFSCKFVIYEEEVGENVITNRKYINNKSFIELDLKRQKAAELLGCGSFRGFTAYKHNFDGFEQFYESSVFKNNQSCNEKWNKELFLSQSRRNEEEKVGLKSKEESEIINKKENEEIISSFGNKNLINSCHVEQFNHECDQISLAESSNSSESELDERSEDVEFEEIHEVLNRVHQTKLDKNGEISEREVNEGIFDGNEVREEHESEELEKSGVPENPIQFELTQI